MRNGTIFMKNYIGIKKFFPIAGKRLIKSASLIRINQKHYSFERKLGRQFEVCAESSAQKCITESNAGGVHASCVRSGAVRRAVEMLGIHSARSVDERSSGI